MSKQLQPPVKTEPPTVIKNESPSSDEIIEDIKNIDIVPHILCEDSIKSEIEPETKHSELVETQVFEKTENSSCIYTENTIQSENLCKIEGNVSKGTGQGVVEVQGSHEYSNTLSNVDTREQLVLNSSRDLNDIRIGIRKAKHPEKTNFAKCSKTIETTSWEKENEKIKVIKAPAIPVEPHEYTSLAKDEHVCNHCQHAYKQLNNLKFHIKQMHRKVTTMYQCPYCTYKSKWKHYIIRKHIILKHKDTKDVQWFQCRLCEKKFKLKEGLSEHMKVHLKHKQMKDGFDLREKRYGCNKCDYETYTSTQLTIHKLTHLKPEEIQYFYCYHCSYKSNRKMNLKSHIFKRHYKNVEIKQGKRYGCNKCDYETYRSTQLKRHKLIHLKPEEIEYFYCYHCSHKNKDKQALKKHIFRHFKNEDVPLHCYVCDFITQKRETIIEHIKKHSKFQNKSE